MHAGEFMFTFILDESSKVNVKKNRLFAGKPCGWCTYRKVTYLGAKWAFLAKTNEQNCKRVICQKSIFHSLSKSQCGFSHIKIFWQAGKVKVSAKEFGLNIWYFYKMSLPKYQRTAETDLTMRQLLTNSLKTNYFSTILFNCWKMC